ncbi:sensor histidine kinase [Leptospira idonii]|uniref:histidine kinase n=1 Tax=Leptospira idonii TaxID=1193500 RepID=A0A4R9M402_9LEPT|nr:histidine kinase dimerization/phosphoacceptor domain -containing protein [Leptospira idonii]TGN20605.1 histidine kinase [Leptospira idonii]
MKPAIRVAVIYLILGFVWIYGSDYALSVLLQTTEEIRIAQNYKGWLFVFLSAVAIYFLLLRELKVQSRVLREKEESDYLYQNILEKVGDSVIVFNLNTWKIDLISEQTGKFFEASLDAIRHNAAVLLERVHPEDRQRMTDIWINRLQENHTGILYRLLFKDGRIKWALENRLFFKGRGNSGGIAIGITNDISAYIENQKELERSLKENEVLLTEVHHRVKNNLSVIISFLQLQSYSAPKESAAILEQSIIRVKAIALVHEKLYSSKNLSSLNSRSYIESLVENIKLMYMRMDIQIDLAIQPKELNLTMAIPMGLMLTEMLTNSFRHAFPERKDAIIKIDFKVHDKGRTELIYRDNGIGFPESFDRKNIDSVGLSVIFSLSSQMMGREIQFYTKPNEGVLYHFEFQSEKMEKR